MSKQEIVEEEQKKDEKSVLKQKKRRNVSYNRNSTHQVVRLRICAWQRGLYSSDDIKHYLVLHFKNYPTQKKAVPNQKKKPPPRALLCVCVCCCCACVFHCWHTHTAHSSKYHQGKSWALNQHRFSDAVIVFVSLLRCFLFLSFLKPQLTINVLPRVSTKKKIRRTGRRNTSKTTVTSMTTLNARFI